jgi:CO/xanthine dehydrogenase Mo-binding subunit
MAFRLVGKDFLPPDVVPKVNGQAKYAEDFRAEGMVFMKLFLSPMPHAEISNIDASAALRMDGVLGVMTADDVAQMPAPNSQILTNTPHYVGEPILAVAAVDEETAANAIELIKLDIRPREFIMDPLDSLLPGSPNARDGGNVAGFGIDLTEIKWTARDFAAAGDGELPMGKPIQEWEFGDLEAGFAASKIVLDETYTTQSQSHHAMEPRSSMAWWEGDKCFLHGSSQSVAFTIPFAARFLGIPPSNLVYVGENCGGGFGGKGAAYTQLVLAAYMSKQIGKPVMLRISRSEEYYFGSARAGFQGRVKIGFGADGRILATDMFTISDNGPDTGFPDWRNSGIAYSIIYQPKAMRFKGIPVLTNTPPKGPQRGPGENQTAAAMEPIMDKAARLLGIDRLALRRINAPSHDAVIGGQRGTVTGPVTSAYMPEVLDIGRARFNWDERKKRSGQVNGTKITGIGIGQAYHSGGANGFDGLVRIDTDGMVHIHSGAGNLGTFSYASTARVVAEVLECAWENCVVHRGHNSKGIPWTLGQFGSLTTYVSSRGNHAAATAAKEKLLELAALELGGSADDYKLKDGLIVGKAKFSSKALTFAAAAKRAIAEGGEFDGSVVPEDVNPMTKGGAAILAGSGLVAAAKDNLERNGTVPALATAFMEIALDKETGQIEVIECLNVADCGTVSHPQGLETQIRGGSVMGFGMATTEKHVYDAQVGLPGNRGFYQTKPPSYLDVPSDLLTDAVNLPDPQHPYGFKGVGEPVMGSAGAALISAISDALGGHNFNRMPITRDMIILHLAGLPQSTKPLAVNTQ